MLSRDNIAPAFGTTASSNASRHLEQPKAIAEAWFPASTLNNPQLCITEKSCQSQHLCTFCGKAFDRRANRLRHERIHTDDRPFLCPLCPKRFITKDNLRYHIERSFDHNEPTLSADKSVLGWEICCMSLHVMYFALENYNVWFFALEIFSSRYSRTVRLKMCI